MSINDEKSTTPLGPQAGGDGGAEEGRRPDAVQNNTDNTTNRRKHTAQLMEWDKEQARAVQAGGCDVPSHFKRVTICGTPIGNKMFVGRSVGEENVRLIGAYQCGSSFCPRCAMRKGLKAATELREIHKRWREMDGQIFYAVLTKRCLGADWGPLVWQNYEMMYHYERLRSQELAKRLHKLSAAGVSGCFRSSEWTIKAPFGQIDGALYEPGNYHGHVNVLLYAENHADPRKIEQALIKINTAALEAAFKRLIKMYPPLAAKMDSYRPLWEPKKGLHFKTVDVSEDEFRAGYVTLGVQCGSGQRGGDETTPGWDVEAEVTGAQAKKGKGRAMCGQELLEIMHNESEPEFLRDFATAARVKIITWHNRDKARAFGWTFKKEAGRKEAFNKFVMRGVKPVEKARGVFEFTHKITKPTEKDVAEFLRQKQTVATVGIKFEVASSELLKAEYDLEVNLIRRRRANYLAAGGYTTSDFVREYADKRDPVADFERKRKRGENKILVEPKTGVARRYLLPLIKPGVAPWNPRPVAAGAAKVSKGLKKDGLPFNNADDTTDLYLDEFSMSDRPDLVVNKYADSTNPFHDEFSTAE